MATQGVNKRKPDSFNNEEMPVKRSRVTMACDQCRSNREKCDGVQPICFTCNASERDCTYTWNPKKRGIQPGYIRCLELTLTWLFQNTDSEALLNRKLSREGASSVLLGRDTKDSNRLHKSWRKSRFCKDLDKLLAGEEIHNHRLDDSRPPESDDEDTDAESTALNFHHQHPAVQPHEEASLTIRRNYAENASPNIASIVIPREPVGVPSPYYSRSNPRQEETSVGAYPTVLPSNRWRLFDLYFAYTNCWFPVSEKHDVMKLAYSYPEHGLLLSSSKLPNSGDHAELWSILALASIQESQLNSTDPHHDVNMDENAMHYTPVQLYDISRTLIPHELEASELGHVKALLILALFNLSQSAPQAAWMVVGHATRIIMGLERIESSRNLRFRHVFAGCFLLDTLVSMQLERRPYLQAFDIKRIGRISEDGLEEWQPWTGCRGIETRHNSRTPVLSLSTFNNLVEITGIMGFTEYSDNSVPSVQEVIGRMELWKASLPPTFDYVRTESVATPLTLPALLLQLTHHCASLVLFSSTSWIHRILELLDRSQNVLGLAALPPILHCLLKVVQRNNAFKTLDRSIEARFQKMQSEFLKAWTTASHFGTQGIVSLHSKRSSTLLDDLLPDMSSSTSAHHPARATHFQNALSIQNFATPRFENAFNPTLLHHRNSTASRDIENFFDELASLDGAERVENQPQFMQNLGFAPDANMADLLSAEYGQLTALNPVYMPENGSHVNHLDPSTFYDRR
ncbi:hypothetical protein K505DRAFT_293639 [Melanomma pulvis-pyrius CBS 109.77]|uniref:Zn(2)-C6 fungal-type domain-containing protein n=1 Tax=Melanomma pulvis-pyrius CBS 109.77 TaxID=1314802 RepID=A0A6A6XUQ4_9PLEO|nr:hypothetical protein K505DRAFT_293639 [Melanomma pulvis-pyrius CBS 109.77]